MIRALTKILAGQPGLAWDQPAQAALQARVPALVRPLVRAKVEERVRTGGGKRVTLADFQAAEARFAAATAGQSQTELKAMLPQENKPGTEMVVLQACRAKLTECPNPLLDSDPWLAALASWLKDKDISERLRRKVGENKILFHHKLKISLSACPNGCSRPQIADVGLVGRAWPELDQSECVGCGACVEACPDQALAGEAGQSPVLDQESCQGCRQCSTVCPADCFTLSPPRLELRLGGRLGRHPRLAEPVDRLGRPEELISILDRLVEDYLTQARLGQRYGDYWITRRRSS